MTNQNKHPYQNKEAWRYGLWFRVFGYGLWFGIDHRPLFSERYGFTRVYRVGRLSMKALKP